MAKRMKRNHTGPMPAKITQDAGEVVPAGKRVIRITARVEIDVVRGDVKFPRIIGNDLPVQYDLLLGILQTAAQQVVRKRAEDAILQPAVTPPPALPTA